MSTPSLFLIAKDLTRIQVWSSVNEADIGNIHSGQAVTFTVDAYPNRIFRGTVNKVRLNATMNQNVVTYTVEVTTDNSDGKLLPYLTANVNFMAGETKDALLVPNSALRWHPQNDLIAPDYRLPANTAGPVPAAAAPAMTRDSRGEHARPSGGGAEKPVPSQTGTLWVAEGRFVRPVQVDLGLTDGTSTEVRGEGLDDGTIIVTGVQSMDASAEEGSDANPFVPKIWQRRGPTNAIPTRRGSSS
jgi:HlyD family secretion protein